MRLSGRLTLHNAQRFLAGRVGDRWRLYGPFALVVHPVTFWQLVLWIAGPLLFLELHGAAQGVGRCAVQLAGVLYRSRP